MYRQNLRKRRARHQRRGAAVVEIAVCLPVIFVVVFGAIEAASMMFLRQALVQSAYEGAKIAVKTDGGNAGAIQAANEVAAGRRINDMQVTFSPSDISTANKGELIRVTVTAPGNSNSFIPFGPFRNRMVNAHAVMVKE